MKEKLYEKKNEENAFFKLKLQIGILGKYQHTFKKGSKLYPLLQFLQILVYRVSFYYWR